jgi:hypothetical protein
MKYYFDTDRRKKEILTPKSDNWYILKEISSENVKIKHTNIYIINSNNIMYISKSKKNEF